MLVVQAYVLKCRNFQSRSITFGLKRVQKYHSWLRNRQTYLNPSYNYTIYAQRDNLIIILYNILYNKFVEHHVIELILLKISKLSAHLTQAIIRDKLQRLKQRNNVNNMQSLKLHIIL